MAWFTILELHTDMLLPMLFQIQVQFLSHSSCSGFTGISRNNKMCLGFFISQIVIIMYLG